MDILFLSTLIAVGLMVLYIRLKDFYTKKQIPYIKHNRFKKMSNDGLDKDGDYESISTSFKYCTSLKWIIEVNDENNV